MSGEQGGSAARQKTAKAQRATEHFQEGMAKYNAATTPEDYADASECFTGAIQWASDNPRFFFARGNCYRAMGVLQKAFEDYSQAIRLDSNNAVYCGNRGVCLRKMEKRGAAIDDYSRAIELDPTNGAFYYNRALARFEGKQHDAALADFGKAVTDKSYAFRALFSRGNCFRALARYPQSETDLKRAIDMRPSSGAAHNGLGMTYFAMKRFEDAVAEFSEALELEESAQFRNNRGLARYHAGSISEAVEDFEAAIAIEPHNPEFLCNRGNAHLARGEVGAAMQDLHRAHELAPESARYCHALGLAYQVRGRYRKALASFESAVALDPSHLPSEYHRGLMLSKLQQNEEAIAALTRVVTAAPKDVLALSARGLVMRDVGLHALALQDFDAALAADPERGESYYHRGHALLLEGKAEAAEEDARRAIEAGFTEPCAYILCAQALRRLDRPQEARDLLEGARAAAATALLRAECCFERAQCAAQAGMLAEAEEDLVQALEAVPGSPRYLFHLARACLGQDKDAEALARVSEALATLGAPDPLAVAPSSPRVMEALECRVEDLPPPRSGGEWEEGQSESEESDVEGEEDAEGDAEQATEPGKAAPKDGGAGKVGEEAEEEEDTGPPPLPPAVAAVAAASERKREAQAAVGTPFAGAGVRAAGAALNEPQTPPPPHRVVAAGKEAGLSQRLLCVDADFLPDAYYCAGVALARAGENAQASHVFSAAITCLHARTWRRMVGEVKTARIAAEQRCLAHAAAVEAEEAHGKEGADRGALARTPQWLAGGGDEPIPPLARSSFDEAMVHERAKARQLSEDVTGAIHDFDCVLERNPYHAHALFRRGFAHKALRHYEEAASDFEGAKALDLGNQLLVVNYLQLHDTDCVVLVAPGKEPAFGE